MDFKNRNIASSTSLMQALKKMDEINVKLLIVIDQDKFDGLISIGDIQRAIISNIDLNESVAKVKRIDPKIATPEMPISEVRQLMLLNRMELCPVVDNNKSIQKIYFWGDLFEEEEEVPVNTFNLPIVIMAGGFGTRLRPLTYVIPKPLVPIGERTMLEEIFDRFGKFGCKEFHISVNYKSDLIKYYIDSQHLPYEVSYFEEDKPMGTAGSLSLLKNKINSTFFVSNCDILIEQDYSEILSYHQEKGNEITLVAALKHLGIPYGTIETGEDGQLLEMKEKPNFDFMINAGMYILEPHLLSEIPENEFFHITHLIEKLKQAGRKVGVFPVSEQSWMDVGQWDEYNKTSKKLGLQQVKF